MIISSHPYQIYNLGEQTYSVRFATLAKAKENAQHFSAIFRRECWVVDTDTGEIMAQYDHGVETYVS